MRLSQRFPPLFDNGGHVFLLFNLNGEAVKPAQRKLPLKQFQCDKLEATAGDRIVVNFLADFRATRSPGGRGH
ncbi:hypothetical protein SDC9_173267 [bioreactor metagenome]|uniref:Uncharacterized protein n=1 Tax=bioreactor metagenome TaxID=1076179 RepID=A0A645GI55_9ZZZZ